ncbi:MAG: DUF5615 family PIN-like protein [Planctomycetes bacterium]|nr:DUF5615 family PIN-like protein [Planctomycetota bacterium]
MILWLDAQLPPSAAAWITAKFSVEARAVRDLGLRDAQDLPVFQAARAAGAVVMTNSGEGPKPKRTTKPPSHQGTKTTKDRH